MNQLFYPDQWAESAYKVDYRGLYAQGIRGIIFDIDNTLVNPNAPADARAKELFSSLKEMGFQTVILSNNTGKRAGTFAQEVGSSVVTWAMKPLPHKYREAMRVMGTDENSTVFIGDQVYTDIWGANNAHVMSILTDPLTDKEEFWIRWKRKLEKPVREKLVREKLAGEDRVV